MVRSVSVAIIGAGPAGISAGIYLERAGLRPLLLERSEPGGLLRSANLVENYPGFPGGIGGADLVRLFCRQLKDIGPEVTRTSVMHVSRVDKSFRIHSSSGDFLSKAMIVASGTRPAEFDIKGIRSDKKRVFSELTDVPRSLRRNKRAVVIGGGDAAFDYALNLAASGDHVTVISRSEPRCLALLRERASENGVEVLIGCKPKSLREITGRADLILAACGRVPNIEFLSPPLRSALGTKDPPETAVKGFYSAGDVVRGVHRQTGIAVGDGIRAAMLAQEFLVTKEGRA